MVDAQLGIRLKDSIQKAFRSYTTNFEKEAQAEKKRYIDLIEKSVNDFINDDVKTQLPQILPKSVSDFTNLVIKSTITESLEDVMAIFIISVSLDSLEESLGTSTGRVILFGTIPTTIPDTTLSVIPPSTHIDTTPIPIISSTIPPSPDYTPVSPDYSLTYDTESSPSEDPSSNHIPPLPATSPFLSLTDDSLDSDIPDTSPSPTHGTLMRYF
nr:hypothetical protein [Tanacetum cinerariifolium]